MTHCDCPSCNRPGKVRRFFVDDKPMTMRDLKPGKIRRFFNWLESCPGGISTLIILAFFVAGAYGTYLLFQVRGK